MADDLVPDWRVQANFKFGPADYNGIGSHLLNVRADDFEELSELLGQVTEDVAAKVANASAALTGVVVVAQALGGDQPVAGVTTLPTSNNTGNIPACAHGTRAYKSGDGAKGFWEAMFCASKNRNDPNKCEPIWRDKAGQGNHDDPYWPAA